MAQSLETFHPTPTMRLLGLVGILAGAILLWAFLAWNPFADRAANTFRLFLFWSGGVAIALALHGRQATLARRTALVATAAVTATGLWNVVWVILAIDRDSPFSGAFGFAGFVASLAGWLAAALYGVVVLVIRATRGMSAWTAMLTRLAAMSLIVGGVLAPIGMDRFGFTRSESYGVLFGTLGELGVSLTGLGWLSLGVVLALGRSGGGKGEHGHRSLRA